MKKSHYTEAFKEQAISKVLQRGDKTIQCVADELNVNVFTLKNWLKKPRTNSMTDTPVNKRPADWSGAQRLALLMESAALEGEALNAFCRQQGLFPHHLEAWKEAFIQATDPAGRPEKSRSEKPLRDEVKQLEKELNRKEKALAEAAALLVLQKKCQAFWEEKA